MNIGSTDPSLGAVSSPDAASTEAMRAKLQVALLKKSLESQQEQAAELMRMTEGKGRVIDIRA